MKYICIIILLILLPVSLFSEKEMLTTVNNFGKQRNLLINSGSTLPLSIELTKTSFVNLRLGTLSGEELFSVNMGVKKAGYMIYNLPLLENFHRGFYRLTISSANCEIEQRVIFVPGSDSADILQ